MKAQAARGIAAILLILAAVTAFAGDVASRPAGTLRGDLVGKALQELPKSAYPSFRLPLPWEATQQFEFHLYRVSKASEVALIARKDGVRQTIVSAVQFAGLTNGRYAEHDCYFMKEANCEGRLCNGVIVGIGRQPTKGPIPASFTPLESWVFTLEQPIFTRISPRGVVCRPQTYAD